MAVDPLELVNGLVQRGVPRTAALGLVGNMGIESGFDPGINEIAPVVPGSRGGWGLYQLTGPRRRAFESYAQQRGVGLADHNAQLDFLVHELGTTESRARDRIYAAQSPEEAARLVSTQFLRPGIPHLDRRVAETMRIAGMDPGQTGNALAAPEQQANAMQQLPQPQQFEYQVNSLDPRAFQSPTNALSQYGFAPGQNPFSVG